METDKRTDISKTELGLQVTPHSEGIEIIFTASDGEFSDIPAAEKYYIDEINSETKELRKLQAIMGFATAFQAYQVIEGVRNENVGVIIPMAVVALLMVYVRNKSMVPTKEKRDISRIKLDLIQGYKNTTPGEEI